MSKSVNFELAFWHCGCCRQVAVERGPRSSYCGQSKLLRKSEYNISSIVLHYCSGRPSVLLTAAPRACPQDLGHLASRISSTPCRSLPVPSLDAYAFFSVSISLDQHQDSTPDVAFPTTLLSERQQHRGIQHLVRSYCHSTHFTLRHHPIPTLCNQIF
jgi:hypothetical protein